MGKHSRKNHQPLFRRNTKPMTSEEELDLLVGLNAKVKYRAEYNCGKCPEVHVFEGSVNFDPTESDRTPMSAAVQHRLLMFQLAGMPAEEIRAILAARNQGPGPLAKRSMRITVLSVGPGDPIPPEAKFE